MSIPDFLCKPGPELDSYATGSGGYAVPITIDGLAEFPGSGVPVRCGLPLPLGLVRDPSQVSLLGDEGQELLVQVRPTAYWHDGSLKWVLLDFFAVSRRAEVRIGPAASGRLPSPLRVEECDAGIEIITGPLKLFVSREEFSFPGRVWLDGSGDGSFTDGGEAFVRLADDEGSLSGDFLASNDTDFSLELEASGPVRATVRLAGQYIADDGRAADHWVIRIHAFAGQSLLIAEHTFVNSVDVRRVHTMALGLELPLAELGAARVRLAIDDDEIGVAAEGRKVSVRQINAAKKAFPRFDQVEPACAVTRGDEVMAKGQKAGGWLAVETRSGIVCAATRDMWKRYPKEIQVDPEAGRLRILLHPETGEPLDWFGGVDPEMIAPTGAPWQAFGDDGIAFSHELLIGFGRDAHQVEAQAGAFCAIPNAYVDPVWLQGTKVLGCVAARDPESFPEIEQRLDRSIEWLDRHQNEWFRWYGIIDHGGVQTHYQPSWEHWSNLTERFGWLNAEAEPQAAVALHYLRSGSRRAFELMRSMVRHLMDVDYVHLGSRRGFGRRHFALHWGQPGDWAHTFLRAPALYYYATGDERVRDVMQEVADLVLRSNVTGYERDAANFMRGALWLYEMTADERYRDKAAAAMGSALALRNEHGIFETEGSQFHTNEYLLWGMMLYDRLIGSDEVREALIRVMDHQGTPFGRNDTPVGPSTARQYQWEGWQHAYLATGDMKYLWPGVRDLATLRYQRIYERYDRILRFPSNSVENRLEPTGEDVRPDTFVSMHFFGRHLTKLPHFLYALRQAGLHDCDSLIDTSICGTHEPWAAEAGIPSTGRYKAIDLQSVANTAATAADPFGYTQCPTTQAFYMPRTQAEQTGQVVEHLRGLPWGVTVFYRSVPYRLAACRPDSRSIVSLRKGESVTIPVNCRAEKLHFLGQVLANGDLARGRVVGRYVIQSEDGGERIIEWRNLINCEDWRYLHYALEAPLTQAWAPKSLEPVIADMTNTRTQLRHINALTVDTEGKFVRQIIFDAAETDALPILLALTAEGEFERPSGRATQLTFGEARRDAQPEYSWQGAIAEHADCVASEGNATLSTPAHGGPHAVECLVGSSGPLAMAIGINGQVALEGWHLVGDWHGVAHPQRISLDAAATGSTLRLGFQPEAGGLYTPNENGRTPWGLGWSFDHEKREWQPPTRPTWRLYEVVVRPAGPSATVQNFWKPAAISPIM